VQTLAGRPTAAIHLSFLELIEWIMTLIGLVTAWSLIVTCYNPKFQIISELLLQASGSLLPINNKYCNYCYRNDYHLTYSCIRTDWVVIDLKCSTGSQATEPNDVVDVVIDSVIRLAKMVICKAKVVHDRHKSITLEWRQQTTMSISLRESIDWRNQSTCHESIS